MHTYLLLASFIAVTVGIIHSVLGEVMIFSKLRSDGWVPTRPAPPLRSSHIRILWATWHLASVFGWAFAGILFALAKESGSVPLVAFYCTAFAFFGGAALVLIGTRGRHPGWLGLLAVATLIFISSAG